MAALLALSACERRGRTGPIPPEPIQFNSADGVQLAATFFRASANTAPGILLVHDAGMDRTVWNAFALRAQRAGYHCLAFDLRGHGESIRGNGETLSYTTFSNQAWRDARYDIDAAKQALLSHGTQAENIAIAGAGIGANLAALYAAGHTDIQALVLWSPGLEYKGIETEPAIEAYGMRPVLFITSDGDAYSAGSCAALKEAAQGFAELRQYPGTAHGVDLAGAFPRIMDLILGWLKPIIGASLPPA